MVLSKIEKDRNKAARNVRDRAHRERCDAYEKDLDGIERAVDVVDLRAAAEALDAQATAAFERMREQEQAYREQIAAIETRIQALRADHAASGIRERRSAAFDALHARTSALKRAVDDRYPDLGGPARWSAAAWTPPQDVLDAMERARAGVVDCAEADADDSAPVAAPGM